MAREKYPFNAWKKLRDADAGLTADDLTALSQVTSSSAELNLLDVLCVKAGQWQVVGYAGTWAHEG